MLIDYELTKQDFIDFNMYHAKNSKVIKKSLFIQRYLFALIFLIIPFPLAGLTDIPLWYWFAVFLATMVLWIAFYPKYLMSATARRISRIVDEGKNKDLLGKHSLNIDEDGLADKTDNGENKINWSGVEKIVSSENHFFIYVSSISAVIIPKRYFETESDKEEFFRFVNGNLK